MANKSYIERKEAWARKMAEKSVPQEASSDRLPPGQKRVPNWPVLDLGIHPEVPLDQWTLRLHGEVEVPVTLSWEQFLDLPQEKQTHDMHCVTTWSRYDLDWEGVRFSALADLVRPKASVQHVFFKGYDGYTTNNPIEVCMAEDVLVAHRCMGKPLTVEHGGPARVVIPRRYAWKGAKFIREICFMNEDQLGFWELRGYSNTADPWTNDRFSKTENPLP